MILLDLPMHVHVIQTFFRRLWFQMTLHGSLYVFLISQNRAELNIHWKFSVVNLKDTNEDISHGRQSGQNLVFDMRIFTVQEDHCGWLGQLQWQ